MSDMDNVECQESIMGSRRGKKVEKEGKEKSETSEQLRI